MMTKDIQSIPLGPEQVKILFELEKEKKVLFTIEDVRRILGKNTSVKQLIHSLQKKGRVYPIQRGLYLLVPSKAGVEGYWSEHSLAVADALLKESYVSFWTALNYWSMTEQLPQTVFICALRQKKALVFQHQRFEFIKMSKKYFFGFQKEKVSNNTVNIATKEKTILDCLLHPEYCGGLSEVTKAINTKKEELDWKLLGQYLKRMGNSAVERRLLYLLDLLQIQNSLKEELEKKDYPGYRWLDPSAKKEVVMHSKKYGLKINVSGIDILDQGVRYGND